ncbi:MAG: ABC transporter substrate-binding protein [Actinomycetota bacterium]|nr:ABC transporter substrate-binding protein [Actinomycetota bacterium]
MTNTTITTADRPLGLPDIVDSITRREFIAMMAAAGLLAACGDDEDKSASGNGGDATRTARADSGTIDVPADPKRVVAAIGSFETDMVAVGVMPVLTTSFAGPWVELDKSVTITENILPTAEELLAVEPDLIVGWNWVTKEPSFEQIRKVAPYVGLGESPATAGPGFDSSQAMKSWDRLFLSVCDAVGRRSQGEKLVAEFEARLDDLAERRQGKPDISVARIEFYEAGSFSYRGQNEDTAELMRRIGLTVVGPDDSVKKESLERLPEIDADWLVVPVGNENIPRALYDEVAATPLFQSIPAVKAGRVHLVDADLWPGLGHLWARALADDLERLFVDA